MFSDPNGHAEIGSHFSPEDDVAIGVGKMHLVSCNCPKGAFYFS
jgi:hypothetical protein